MDLSDKHQAEFAAESLVRRLAGRYVVVLTAVAGLVVADQAIVQPLLSQLDGFAPAINVAGRQRMLSQRISKSALALERLDEPAERDQRREELRVAVLQWTAAHEALRNGDPLRGIRPVASPEINQEWAFLEPHFQAIRTASSVLVAEPADATDASTRAAALTTIVANERPFLESMDRLVSLLEEQSTSRLRRLRAYALAIAATIVLLLVGLGWFVVRPATRAIRAQVDGLESEVERQTGKLADALSALRHEAAVRETAQEQNRRLARQLAHADRVESTGHLAAGLAHELNQPLAAIANFAAACQMEMTRSAGADPAVVQAKSREFIAQIEASAHRAGEIVRRIRKFVRPDSGQSVHVDLKNLIGEVVQLCRPEATRCGADLTVHLPDEPMPVHVDAIQIQQVIVNLLQNALQAVGDAPETSRKIAILATLQKDAVQVDVSDTGPGLSGEDPEKLFAPFHTTKHDGLGVGLAICRSIVEQHEGAIWARASADGGAQFSFTLPLAEPPHTGPRPLQADGVRG
jgi:two-component system sensor kinase FixL